jgi:putative peptidoglycan lipid II flippase
MAFGTMTSRILGQVRESMFAYYFDKRITDAWNAAFRLPNMFRRLLGEGSLSVSFIPVFVEAQHDSQKRAQNLVNSVYSFLLVVLGTITTLGILYPEPLLNLVLDQAYILDHEKYLLTLRMTKIMFGFIFFISSYAFSMGILNALGQYLLPAIAPTFLNICMIISTTLPDSYFLVHGDQLSIGVLIGGAVQLMILIPALIKSGYFPKISFYYRNPDFLRVIRNMVPGLLGMGLLQFTTIINLRFSSSLPEGTISYINYVDRLVELPLSLISVSLGTALLPALSGFLARNEKQKFCFIARHYLELNLMMTMAAAAGLYVLAQPVVQLLFGRGKFGPEDVLATAEILKTYCWIMIFSSGVRVLTPAYYAIKNTWFPALVACICLTVHIIIAPLLIAQLQVHGLMISTIISAALNVSLLLVFFKKFVGDFEYLQFFKNLGIFSGLAIVTGGVANIYFFNATYLPTGSFYLMLNIFFSVLLSLVVFAGLGYAFKINAVTEALDKVLRKLKKQNK